MSKTDLNKLGAAQAVLLSCMLGVLALSFVNLGTEMSEAFKGSVQRIGNLWMPGAGGIGPYSGKETLALLVWFLSWFLFHRILRGREWHQGIVIVVFLAGLGIATTVLWPPATQAIAHTLVGY